MNSYYNLPIPKKPESPITLAIVGAGARGKLYAEFATLFPDWVKVVAVADHHKFNRDYMVEKFEINQSNVFNDWREMAKLPKLCNAVAICTTDREHVDPAIAFANLKYNILLEKPMAIQLDDCSRIVVAIKENNVMFAVGHVLRYTPYTYTMMKLIGSGILGDIVNVQHLEPVGFWHFAHSFVRGTWNNESTSTFSLLSKSCHDLDLISFMMGKKCRNISSFGSLKHFKPENKPTEAGNAKNCLDCNYSERCPYSAKKIYIEPFVKEGITSWPIDVVQPTGTIDIESLTSLLRSGNYGSCVYSGLNDVCDNQVVNMEFEDGSTASFSMVAFTQAMCERKTRIFGTRGELEGDGVNTIKHFDFCSKKTEILKPSVVSKEKYEGLPGSGHGGGDFALMQAFVFACVTGDKRYILSGPEETFDSHLYVFAAEQARKSNTVINIDEFSRANKLHN